MSELPEAGVESRANRDQLDLEAVYRRDGERLWRSLLVFSGDRDVAIDAVAEAFAQALRRGTEIRDPAAWVWRAAFRIAAGELKRRLRIPPGEWTESYEDPEPRVDLLRALASLSRSQRAAVLLHHYAGYPVRDVARIMGSTSAAVRVHLHRGRRRLHDVLEEYDDA